MTLRQPLRALGAASLAAVLLAAPALAQDAPPPAAPAPHHQAPRAKPKPVAAAPAARKPEAKDAAKEAITVPVPSVAELQPLQHARNGGVKTCLNSIAKASVATVDAPHKANSSWVKADPDNHIFQSIVGLDYRNRTAPNSATVIVATPTPERGCDSTTVQVYPTARACGLIRTELMKDGSLTDELSGMPLVRSPAGIQHLLLPAPGNGCVIVAVGIGINAPEPQAAAGQPPVPASPKVQPVPVQPPATQAQPVPAARPVNR